MHGSLPHGAPGEALEAAELLELGDALVEVDAAWRVVRVNRNQERISGRPREDLLGRTLWEAWPEAAHPGSAYWREYHRCMAERVPVHFEEYFAPLRLWTGVTAYPTRLGGIAIFTRDVTEQKRAEQALVEASRRKDELLGVLSHELRNPLAPIQNSVHTLAHADPESEQAVRARAIISRQVQHLTRLVDDLLDLKRLSTGKLRLHPRPIDLGKAVRETVEDLRPLFARRGIRLELEAPRGDPGAVDGDATRIAQALGNLLNNALKFTNAGGRVVVTMERTGASARIGVRDDGVGIEPALLEKLFEPFVQADGTIHRSRSGLGLGLALVKGIAELHGGTVAARSDGPGRGAEFVLTVPAIDRAADAGRLAARPGSSARRRVLVVDDDEDAAQSLRDVLDAIGGHDAWVATTCEEAVEEVRRLRPDVVLCDLGLGGVDGHEVARRLRASSRVGRLVALTGRAAPEDVDRALRAGFDYHVPKPPDLDRLLRLVSEAPPAGARAAVPPEIVTDHPELDAQHAGILAEAARLRRVEGGEVWEAQRFRGHHTATHFDYEERVMADVAFPGLAGHRARHVAFAERLAALRDELVEGGATPARVAALASAVERWVTEHVLGEDRRVAEFLRARR